MRRLAKMPKFLNRALAGGIVALLLLFSSCTGSNIFPDIGDTVYNPIAVEADATTGRLYLVNSNYAVFYKTGSFQVYDISADATEPVLMDTIEINSFSGHMHYDAAGKFIYLTNRYSEDGFGDPSDYIFKINVDETSDDYLTVEQFADGKNPFGLFYDAVTQVYYVASANSALDYFTDPTDITAIDLENVDLSDGTILQWSDFRDVAVVGDQAWLARSSGGLLMYDLAGEKCDYFFNDFRSPRAIATDGTNVYLTSVESVDGDLVPMLYVLDPSKAPVRSGNTTCEVVEKDSLAGFVLADPETADNPQEILISDDYIFVSNQGANTVSVIDRASYAKVKDIAVGNGPFGMGLYKVGGVDTYVYVTNITANTISVIDIPTLKVLNTF